jgi:hypothetical protein
MVRPVIAGLKVVACGKHGALQGWRSIGGRGARCQVPAIVPAVTRLRSRNTRNRPGMIGKHFCIYECKMSSCSKMFS